MSLFKFLYLFYIIVFLTIFSLVASLSYAEEEDNNYIKINKVFLKDSHWSFRLKEVSRNNDLVKISIRFVNKGSYRRPIFLAQGSTQAITSIDEDGGVSTSPSPKNDQPLALLISKNDKRKYIAHKVNGISANKLHPVEKNKGQTADFYFNVPEYIKEAYFISEWVTIIMRGAAGVIPIKILLRIP